MSTTPTIRREYAAENINAVCNHPEVAPWLGFQGPGPIDLTPVVQNLRNVLLMGDGGGFVFVWLAPGLYEAHSQFVPESRGENATQAAHAASHFMFTRTDCTEIVTRVPRRNVAASAYAQSLGWKLAFRRERAWDHNGTLIGCDYYSKTINQWAATAPELEELGHRFHETLEAVKASRGATSPVHEDDEAHDRFVGATVAMVTAGQVGKGIDFYCRWAAFAGYGPISLVAMDPPVVDIGDALIAVKEGSYEVLLCR